MKIVDIKVHHLQKQLTSTMQISRGGFTVRNHIIVEVITDSGLTGLGEGIGNADYIKALLKGPIGKMAIGLDPLDIDRVRSTLIDNQVYFERMGSAICAASAIETACWDIAGKFHGVPVYELLGGLKQKSLSMYASDVYWEEDIDKMLERIKAIKSLGIKTVKAHIGYKPPNIDIDRVSAMRAELGSGYGLMIDLNCGYDLTQSCESVALWKEYDLTWLEEPLNPNLYQEMSTLKKQSDIPIAAGENEFLVHGFKTLFEHEAVDIAMPDVGRVGGIQEALNVCQLASEYGVAVSPHNYSSGVLLAATAQLMAATDNCKLLEFDASDNAVYEEMLTTPIEIDNGNYIISSDPGLGVALTEDVLNKYAI